MRMSTVSSICRNRMRSKYKAPRCKMKTRLQVGLRQIILVYIMNEMSRWGKLISAQKCASMYSIETCHVPWSSHFPPSIKRYTLTRWSSHQSTENRQNNISKQIIWTLNRSKLEVATWLKTTNYNGVGLLN
jgi:hypothetical protein